MLYLAGFVSTEVHRVCNEELEDVRDEVLDDILGPEEEPVDFVDDEDFIDTVDEALVAFEVVAAGQVKHDTS